MKSCALSRKDIKAWSVDYGVNRSHLYECAGVFDRLKDARKAYEAVELKHPWGYKRILRMTFETRKSTCMQTDVIDYQESPR